MHCTHTTSGARSRMGRGNWGWAGQVKGSDVREAITSDSIMNPNLVALVKLISVLKAFLGENGRVKGSEGVHVCRTDRVLTT